MANTQKLNPLFKALLTQLGRIKTAEAAAVESISAATLAVIEGTEAGGIITLLNKGEALQQRVAGLLQHVVDTDKAERRRVRKVCNVKWRSVADFFNAIETARSNADVMAQLAKANRAKALQQVVKLIGRCVEAEDKAKRYEAEKATALTNGQLQQAATAEKHEKKWTRKAQDLAAEKAGLQLAHGLTDEEVADAAKAASEKAAARAAKKNADKAPAEVVMTDAEKAAAAKAAHAEAEADAAKAKAAEAEEKAEKLAAKVGRAEADRKAKVAAEKKAKAAAEAETEARQAALKSAAAAEGIAAELERVKAALAEMAKGKMTKGKMVEMAQQLSDSLQ